jgi:hypothetical protein
METKEEILMDKSDWGDGPWQREPDRVEWKDPATGLDCLITRHDEMGHLCGYVAVPPGHPAYGKHYGDLALDAHGGVNYSDACQGKVCHVPQPGDTDEAWWFGFDCAHAFDFGPGRQAMMRRLGMPSLMNLLSGPEFVYRDLEYVKANVTDLAAQLGARR